MNDGLTGASMKSSVIAHRSCLIALAVVAAIIGNARPIVAQGTATASPTRDLAADERAGGHTLTRHVGKSDAELAERLSREHDISAASTYTDALTAANVVGAALAQSKSK